jgi:UDP-N-acetylmuramyl pentapeptide phosphotransferase/UDP-N-acetylglucosamine-1-phosphate transferase
MCLPLCLSFCPLLQKVLNYLKEKADQIKQTDSKETPENGGNYVLLNVCLSVCLFVCSLVFLSLCS